MAGIIWLDFISVSIILIILFLYFASIIALILDNRNSTSTLAWLMLVIVLPLIGLLLYLFLGRNWRKVAIKKQDEREYVLKKIKYNFTDIAKDEEKEFTNLEKMYRYDANILKLSMLVKNNSSFHLSTNNYIKVLTNGHSKFKELLEDLKRAESFIHMQYFIWYSDELGDKIAKILMKKAKEGVEVRVIYDSLGSLPYMSRKYKKKLKESGVNIQGFFNLKKISNLLTLNYRNHTKIVVIDGSIGYTGGLNIGQEYIDGGKRYESWRDTHIKIVGDCVKDLQAEFAVSWYQTTQELLNKKKYFPVSEKHKKKIPVQIISSGPDSKYPAIKQMLISLINSAQKSIIWQTPYFVIDESVSEALKIASLSGVDIKIMITGIPDKKIPYWAAFTYFDSLLRTGVKIYHYMAGYMHLKVMLIDEKVCTVGTTNADIRSFDLHYEVNALIYDSGITLRLKKDFDYDLLQSKEFTIDDYKQISSLKKLRNSIARLLSPLL